MSKLLLVGSLLVVALGVAGHFWNYTRRVQGKLELEVSQSALELARALIEQLGRGAEVIKVRRRVPFFPHLHRVGEVVLAPPLAESRRAGEVARALQQVGLLALGRRAPQLVRWRVEALRFGSVAPALGAMVLGVAAVSRALTWGWALSLWALLLALAVVGLLFTQGVERTAAQAVAGVLRDRAVVRRRAEGELLAQLVEAEAWRGILPGVLQGVGARQRRGG